MVSVTDALELVDDVLLLDEELHAASASAAAAATAAAAARFLFKILISPRGSGR
jgi:hypothetical protein